jgi:pyrroline-5-carboxylate reductase
MTVATDKPGYAILIPHETAARAAEYLASLRSGTAVAGVRLADRLQGRSLDTLAAAAPGSADRQLVEHILGAVGSVLWVEREPLIDAVTAVSGSGPAYVFLLIEALEAAALEAGFDAAQARQLALETFRGASTLAATDAEPPAVLRARVTSKGGTTERGVAALEAGGVRQAMAQAVAAAGRRAVELADVFGQAD